MARKHTTQQMTREDVANVLAAQPGNRGEDVSQLAERWIVSDRFVLTTVHANLPDLGVTAGKTGRSVTTGPIIVDENVQQVGRLGGSYGAAPAFMVLDGQNRVVAARAKGPRAILQAFVGQTILGSLRNRDDAFAAKYAGLQETIDDFLNTPELPGGKLGELRQYVRLGVMTQEELDAVRAAWRTRYAAERPNPIEDPMSDEPTAITEPVDDADLVVGEFEVYVEVLPKLTEKLDKFIARAKRLGLSPLAYEVGEVENRVYVPEDNSPEIPYQVRKVFIVGTPPKIKGWTFVAKLEHTEAGNLVNHMNRDIELPESYRESAPWCEHCGKTRKRSQSYVLRSDDGRYVQVGKSCLADFLGRGDPGMLAEVASMIQLAIEAGEAYAKGYGPPPDPTVFSLSDFLAAVFEDIAKRGWKDKNNTRYPEPTTLQAATEKLNTWRTAQKQPDKAETLRPAPEFYVQAAEASQWAASTPMEEADDFKRNLGIIARTGVMTRGQASRAIWIAHAREAAKEREARRRAREAEEASKIRSKHVGTVGERIATILHVDRVVELGQSQFGAYGGTRYLFGMRDDDGNQIMWITGGHHYEDVTGLYRTLDKGSSHAAVCTVEKHDDYKGTPQTTVERCKFGPSSRKVIGPVAVPSPTPQDAIEVLTAAVKGPLFGVGLSMYGTSPIDSRLGYVAASDKPTNPQANFNAAKGLPLNAIHDLIDRQVLAPVETGDADHVRRPLGLTQHGWAEVVRLGLASAADVPKPTAKRKGKLPKPTWATADQFLMRLADELYHGADEGGSAFSESFKLPGERSYTRVYSPMSASVPGQQVPSFATAETTVNAMIDDGTLDWTTMGSAVRITAKGLLRALDLGVRPSLTDADIQSLAEFDAASPVVGAWDTFHLEKKAGVFSIGQRNVPRFYATFGLVESHGPRWSPQTETTLSEFGKRVLREIGPRRNPTGDPDAQNEVVVREYEVADSHIDVLRKQLDGLMKKAAKLKLGTLVYEVGPLERKTVRVDTDLGGGKDFELFFHRVLVVGEYPVIAGWRIVARILHTDEGNVVMQLQQGEPVPTKFRKTKNVCEHCGLSRKRIETFVLRSDAGQYKQVGTDCLGDFVGSADPAAMLDPYYLLMKALLAAEAAQDEGEEGYGEGKGSTIDLEMFLSWVAMAAEQVGWKGRKSADVGMGIATVDAAIDLLMRWQKATKEGVRSHPRPDAKHLAKAKAAIAWASAIPEADQDDFTHNLNVIAKLGYVQSNTQGVAAWIVRGYEKSLELASKAEHSAWLGKVGDRMTMDLKLVRTIVTAGYRDGPSYGHVFDDAEGREVIWWTTKKTLTGYGRTEELEPGSRHVMTCTVKEHTERKGQKQTVVTRCDLAPADAKPGAETKAKPKKLNAEMRDVLAHVALFGGVLRELGGVWAASGLSKSFWSVKTAPVTALRNLELLEPVGVVSRGKPDLRLTAAGAEAAKAAVAEHDALAANIDALKTAEMRALGSVLRTGTSGLQLNNQGMWSLYQSDLEGHPTRVIESLESKGLAARTPENRVLPTKEAEKLGWSLLAERTALRFVRDAEWLLDKRPDLVQVLTDLERGGNLTYWPGSQSTAIRKLDEQIKWVTEEIVGDAVPVLRDHVMIAKSYLSDPTRTIYDISSYGQQFLLTHGLGKESRW